MRTEVINVGLITLGQTISVPVTDLINRGDLPIAGVYVQVDVPAGLVFVDATVPQGSVNQGMTRWMVGTMFPGDNLSAVFNFNVVDPALAPYKINFLMSAPELCAPCDDSREYCVEVQGISIDQISAALGNTLTLGANKIQFSSGDPNGVVVGMVGDLYLRTDGGPGTTLYVKESDSAGTSGWTPK